MGRSQGRATNRIIQDPAEDWTQVVQPVASLSLIQPSLLRIQSLKPLNWVQNGVELTFIVMKMWSVRSKITAADTQIQVPHEMLRRLFLISKGCVKCGGGGTCYTCAAHTQAAARQWLRGFWLNLLSEILTTTEVRLGARQVSWPATNVAPIAQVRTVGRLILARRSYLVSLKFVGCFRIN